MIRLSLVVAVLDSHEIVRRQLLQLSKVLGSDCELVVVDDGSEPSLESVFASRPPGFRACLHRTCDTRPWTQPRARNIGAGLAVAPKLLFFDIDHIVTADVVTKALEFGDDKMHWYRRPAVLDADGMIVRDADVLRDYGAQEDRAGVHGNSFVIRRTLFERLGGYDERFCGRYGGDDIDFNKRYAQLVAAGTALPESVSGEGFVFPDPARDVHRLFHRLQRK